MKSLPYWFFGLATLFALAGMLFGIWMGISENFALAPAHAHNNLIGFVTMALYGIYYRLVPAAAAKPLARIHFWVALAAALIFPTGIALATLNINPMVVVVGSLLVVLAMLIFAWTVWTNRAGLTNP